MPKKEFDWSKYDSNHQSFDWSKYETPKEEEEGLGKAALRTGLQIPKALYQMSPTGLAAEAFSILGKGDALQELEDLEERLPELKKKFPYLDWPESINREEYLKALEQAESFIPTASNLSKQIESSTGLPTETKTNLDKIVGFVSGAGKLAPGSIPQRIGKGLTSEALKEGMEETGIPEPVAEALALAYALHEKTPGPSKQKRTGNGNNEPLDGAGPSNKGAPPDGGGFPPAWERETFESGLSKPRAVESKSSNLARIDPERQKIVIRGLDKEASELAQGAVKKHLPLAEEIAKGTDLESQFYGKFGELKKLAEKYNPEINITPVTKFMKEKYSSYKGIPAPHPEAIKIKNEIRKFISNPQTGMGNLLKIYRSNNKKMSQIYETAHATGKQKEYVDFLKNLNKAIAESFEMTLPEGSEWLKSFKENNKLYSDYIDTKKALQLLDPLLKGRLTSSKVGAIANNPKVHKKLQMSMGDKGAQEIIQIAKDLETAREAIKRIPKKKLSAFNSIFPIGLVIPYINIPVGIVKGAQGASELYGYYLSNPAKRAALDNSLKALENGDLSAYKEATKELKDIKA